MTIKSVAIIGGGPSGLITLDALISEQKFDLIRLFERRSEAGGSFSYQANPPEKLKNIKALSERKAFQHEPVPSELPAYVPKSATQRFMDTATYSYLESNVEASVMEFSKERFPEALSSRSIEKYGKDTPFRHNTQIKQWVQDLYKRKGHDDHIEFNTSVELIEKNENYTLTLRRFGINSDYVWQEHFDAVVVASGHYDVPYVPDIPGLDDFMAIPHTETIHSKAFRTREQFRNKKTVVVGASISAMDAVQDIVGVAKSPIISARRSDTPNIYFGDHAFNHPQVIRTREVTKINGQTVHFKDGQIIDDVDAIIFGTGFSYAYPFLPNLNLTGNKVNGLYQLIFKIDEPRIAFVGAITAGFTFKAFEWQAVYVARVFAERAQLPSIKDQNQWVEERLERKGEGPNYSSLAPDFEEYFETVRKLAGEEGPGRRLPKWNARWESDFWRGHQRRIRYWIENNNKPPHHVDDVDEKTDHSKTTSVLKQEHVNSLIISSITVMVLILIIAYPS